VDLLHPSAAEDFAATMTDEAAARRFMEEDPVIADGFATGELRPFRVSLLRGRD
jgi:hypothetical protein